MEPGATRAAPQPKKNIHFSTHLLTIHQEINDPYRMAF